jgi:hypothetical protein
MLNEHRGSSLNNQLTIERIQEGANGGGSCYSILHVDPHSGGVTPMMEIKF